QYLSVLARDPRVAASFFFFQAEDGIRDPLVTGVQTCALSDLGVYLLLHWDIRQPPPQDFVPEELRKSAVRITTKGRELLLLGNRSEERRVGKDCSWRGEKER